MDEILVWSVKVETDGEGRKRRGAGCGLVVRGLTYRWGDGEGVSSFVEVLLVCQIVRALGETAEQLKASLELHSLLAET